MRLLHDIAQGNAHNENEVKIKNYAPHGPEGQWSKERLRAVQCRPSILNPPNLELRNSEQAHPIKPTDDNGDDAIRLTCSPTDFRKDWQRRVRTHFDQPGKKASRRVARQAKAAALAPRPVDKLRPIVRCPTIKYNRRVRAGRGFTLTELKEAGIARPLARTIGIAVDHRRQNLSEESLAINVARLKAYKERLILLPRKSNAPKKGDTKTDLSKVNKATSISSVLPIAPTDIAVKEIKKSEMPKPIDGGAYTALRMARSNKRYQGAREKRARDKAEAETAKK
ncbi:60S ribosomal protein L13 [Metarhizium acridum CQMa 102]|uniref:60S ribosomal protein L13 n=1 Tax=Metarhizium acridum (strain CQMa 102) TaxID=655827 RepID=E9E4J4_METAQ|nr:60S ribosomal protein L13 [Metarhizium acridum CQMa 102]EFY89205.1 60S ribosomal protein L13 [Metarhizium acridum CQMa 102]